MKDQSCQVVYQKPLQGGYHQIGLKTDWTSFVPGQFGMLEVPQEQGVLLRRPFSFARQVGTTTEILYKAVGKGTIALSHVQTGRTLNLLGPLGHGFSIPSHSGDFVGVAGGYGVAPFLEMALQLQRKKIPLQLFYGARNKQDLLYLDEFRELGVTLHLSTVDGSEGYKGLITEFLANIYKNKKPDIVWSCGPMGLLQAVQTWGKAQNVLCELSVEETMGCGTGVCLGCVVQDIQGHYRRACVEGPVFDSKILKL